MMKFVIFFLCSNQLNLRFTIKCVRTFLGHRCSTESILGRIKITSFDCKCHAMKVVVESRYMTLMPGSNILLIKEISLMVLLCGKPFFLFFLSFCLLLQKISLSGSPYLLGLVTTFKRLKQQSQCSTCTVHQGQGSYPEFRVSGEGTWPSKPSYDYKVHQDNHKV